MVSGAKDLVDEAAAGNAVSEFEAEALPEPLRALPPAERQARVDAQLAERQRVQARIADVARERDAYLKKEDAKLRASGSADAFDQKVYDAIKSQAAAKGIRYE